MKQLLFSAVLALAGGGLASANVPELFLVTGSTNATVTGSGNSVSYTNPNFGGWELDVVFGKSNSPGLIPYGIDLTTLSAACVGGGTCADLHVWLSDTGFTQAATSFVNVFSSTQTGSNASATQKAWVGLGNTFFQSDGSDGTPTVAGGSSIPTVGPITGAGGFGMTTANITAPGSGHDGYSLTIEDIFAGCTGTSCASYSSDGHIIGGVPEPASIALFGTALAVCASRLRRRKAA
jgi:hypothetical protein